MKLKSKPIARAEIREKMEKKFRARGAVAFHLFLVLGASILLLYNLPQLWASRLGFSTPNFIDLIVLFGILSISGALHFIRYYYRHGRGRDRHEAETAARIFRQLQLTNAEDAEEQEELIRLQMEDRLRNKRLAWQHLAIFVGIASIFLGPTDRVAKSNLRIFSTFFLCGAGPAHSGRRNQVCLQHLCFAYSQRPLMSATRNVYRCYVRDVFSCSHYTLQAAQVSYSLGYEPTVRG